MEQLDLQKYGYHAVQIETRADCNIDCKFCAYGRRQDRTSILPTDTVYRLIDEIATNRRKIRHLVLANFNEPTLDQRLFDFVGHAREKGITTFVTTNGTLLHRQAVNENLWRNPPDQLRISIQTIKRENFNHIRGIKTPYDLYFDRIIDFLVQAKTHGLATTLDVACNYLSSPQYYFRRILGLKRGDPFVPSSRASIKAEIIEFFHHLQTKAPVFQIDFDRLDFFLNDPQVSADPDTVFKVSETIDFRIVKFMYGHRLRTYIPTHREFSCRHIYLTVLANGHVVPCCHMTDPLYSMGTIENTTIADILHDNRSFLCNLRAASTDKPLVCRRCWGYKSHRGRVVEDAIRKIRREKYGK